ncbi:MAG: helix-turn-helix domain-containing protein [Pseudomonadota bacterium]
MAVSAKSVTPKARGRPARLNRERVVAAAIECVGEHGIEALSMRQIGASLGASAMAIYRYVADRDDLLLAMLDHVARTIAHPPVNRSDREEIVAVMMALHSGFRSHPWVVRVLLFEGKGSLLVMPLVERIFAALDRLGLDIEASIEAYLLLLHYSYGESLSFETAERRQEARAAFVSAGFEAFPTVRRATAASAGRENDEYERNLRRIVAAL